METLTSAANPLLKDVRRAVHRGGLTSDGLCVAEGFHLLEEAVRSDCETPVVIAVESVSDRLNLPRNSRLVVVVDHLFQTLSATETSQGVIALVRLPEWSSAHLLGAQPFVVILDGLQDPGNAGAIVRAAEAFGATGILYTKGTVSPHNPKAIRASMGSLFRVPHLTGIPPGEVPDLLAGLILYSAEPWSGTQTTAAHTDFTTPCAIVIGNEGSGLSPALRKSARPIAIPTSTVESLNAAMAASILLYEMRRQRA